MKKFALALSTTMLVFSIIATVMWKELQSEHEIVFQGRVDGLRILFGLKFPLVDADQFLSFAGFLTKTVISDAI